MSTPFLNKTKYALAVPVLRVLDWVSAIGVKADVLYGRVFRWTQA